jgi:hypothetical protein
MIVIGMALGRNVCVHAGWPLWIGFIVGPVAVILAGVGFNALLGAVRGVRRGGRAPKSDPQDESRPNARIQRTEQESSSCRGDEKEGGGT